MIMWMGAIDLASLACMISECAIIMYNYAAYMMYVLKIEHVNLHVHFAAAHLKQLH